MQPVIENLGRFEPKLLNQDLRGLTHTSINMQTSDTITKIPYLARPQPITIYDPYGVMVSSDTLSKDRFDPFNQFQTSKYDSLYSTEEIVRPDFGTIIKTQNYDWVTMVLIFCFLLLALVRYNHNRRLRQVLSACYSSRYINLLQREGNLFNEQIMLALGAVYLGTISLFFMFAFNHFELLDTRFIKPPIIFTGLLLFFLVLWLIKAAANRVIAFVFETYNAADNYSLNDLLFNLTIGLLLLPVLPFIIYAESEIAFWLAAAMIGIVWLYKIVRGVMIGYSDTKFPLFYLLIFIFSLEFLPILIVVKLLMVFSDTSFSELSL